MKKLPPTPDSARFGPALKAVAGDIWRSWPLFLLLALFSDVLQREVLDPLRESHWCYQTNALSKAPCPPGREIYAVGVFYWTAFAFTAVIAYWCWRTIVHQAMPKAVVVTGSAYVGIVGWVSAGAARQPAGDLFVITLYASGFALRFLVPWWMHLDRAMRAASAGAERPPIRLPDLSDGACSRIVTRAPERTTMPAGAAPERMLDLVKADAEPDLGLDKKLIERIESRNAEGWALAADPIPVRGQFGSVRAYQLVFKKVGA